MKPAGRLGSAPAGYRGYHLVSRDKGATVSVCTIRARIGRKKGVYSNTSCEDVRQRESSQPTLTQVASGQFAFFTNCVFLRRGTLCLGVMVKTHSLSEEAVPKRGS